MSDPSAWRHFVDVLRSDQPGEKLRRVWFDTKAEALAFVEGWRCREEFREGRLPPGVSGVWLHGPFEVSREAASSREVQETPAEDPKR